MRIRQGDILLIKIEKIPQGAKVLKDKVLAYGEVSFHSHRFADDSKIDRYELDGKLYLQVYEPVELTHEEHVNWQAYGDMGYTPATGMILPGVYEQVAEREYSYIDEEMRKVQD